MGLEASVYAVIRGTHLQTSAVCLNQPNIFTLFVKAMFNMLPNHKLLIIEDTKKIQIEYVSFFLVVKRV